jgi:hypothetical protein
VFSSTGHLRMKLCICISHLSYTFYMHCPFHSRFLYFNSIWRSAKYETCFLWSRGSNPGGGEIFRTWPDRLWEPHILLYNGYRISFPGVKGMWRGLDHPPPSSAEVKERVEYSPSGPSWPVPEWPLSLRVTCTLENRAPLAMAQGHSYSHRG